MTKFLQAVTSLSPFTSGQQQLKDITDWETFWFSELLKHGCLCIHEILSLLFSLDAELLPRYLFSFSSGLVFLFHVFHIFFFFDSHLYFAEVTFWSNFLRMGAWEVNFMRPWFNILAVYDFEVKIPFLSNSEALFQCLITSSIIDDTSNGIR